MEGNKVDVVFPVIAGTKWECVALLCDDTGLPKTAEKRLEVFEALMKKVKEYDIPPSRMHIDPLVEMLCTSEDGINNIIEVMREIKNQYPTIHITGGASNISFNLPARKFVNQAFIVMAMGAGMDSAIINPLHKHMMGLIYATEALKGNDEFCIEYINGYREGLYGPVK
jgi:5-methyltetrahydrofolate--homocysteine methyltransferase